MGSTIGLIMVGAAIAMLIVARPRNGEVVGWLSSEYSQWAYTMALLLLLTAGSVVALHG
jgi:hypothetical protein